MNTLRNEIIRASAGTGKTFALSDRIVRLLALGVAPETIIALTFTRKAAAEFVAAVFRKLADAALDERHAGRLNARLELNPELSGADFSKILAAVVRAMDRLQFGTLDSFFQRIVGAIPFELELSGPVRVLDESAAAEAREQALQRLIHADPDDEAARRDLLDAFRQATWGAEEKRLLPRLLRFVEDCHELYLATSALGRWGRADAIWADGCRWIPAPKDVSEAVVEICAWAEAKDGRFAKAVCKFAAQAGTWQPGMEIPGDAIAGQLFEAFSKKHGSGELELSYYNKPCTIPAEIVPAFSRIVRRYLGASLAQALSAAHGIHRLLGNYDRAYHVEVRQTGRLAFSDVTELLRGVDPSLWQPRIDHRFAHWLFDEFQDTNLTQWSVLANLIDEVLQDPSGTRSVFFVGDPKQSIYRWRGGEHRLLARLEEEYGPVLDIRTLDESRRSTPRVIEFVNLMGAEVARSANRLPLATVEEWTRIWRPHVSAVTEGEGHVRVSVVDDLETLADALLKVLREVDPIGRGRTCAILTRGNDEAADLTHALRERGFYDIAAETDIAITTDQPVTQTLLALLSAAAHPGDMASRRIVEMSPLAAWVSEAGSWLEAREKLLRGLTVHGYEATFREVLKTATGELPATRFIALRLEQFFDIAREFDTRVSRSPDDFLRQARKSKRRETASSGRVQVMTVHKAKGLGFDLVLLPVMGRKRMDAAETDPLLVAMDDRQQPRWVLGRPPSAVIKADPELSLADEAARADSAYEALCVLYVALTRARFGLHVFVGPATKDETSLSPVGLIRNAVTGGEAPAEDGLLWERGDAAWFSHAEKPMTPVAESPGRADWSAWPPAVRLLSTLPSQQAWAGLPALDGPASALLAGEAVHAAFAAIEWIDEGPPTRPEGVLPETWDVVLDCLARPAIAAVFRRPEPTAEAWRERAFDIRLGDRWVSGIFDRVIVGETSATLVDFKTDSGSPEAARERHRSQMQLYRMALRGLVRGDSITVLLVHVPSGTVVEMPDGAD